MARDVRLDTRLGGGSRPSPLRSLGGRSWWWFHVRKIARFSDSKLFRIRCRGKPARRGSDMPEVETECYGRPDGCGWTLGLRWILAGIERRANPMSPAGATQTQSGRGTMAFMRMPWNKSKLGAARSCRRGESESRRPRRRRRCHGCRRSSDERCHARALARGSRCRRHPSSPICRLARGGSGQPWNRVPRGRDRRACRGH